jgi:hypothetical protein
MFTLDFESLQSFLDQNFGSGLLLNFKAEFAHLC